MKANENSARLRFRIIQLFKRARTLFFVLETWSIHTLNSEFSAKDIYT